MEKNNIAIIGGAGFVGSRLAKLFLIKISFLKNMILKLKMTKIF